MEKQSYKNLEIWQKAVTLVTDIYQATADFPKEEIYSLTSQIRRGAVSIPSNIAEGASRYSAQEFIRFINIARGSAAELETQLLIAHNLGYLSAAVLADIEPKIDEVGRMLSGLKKSLDKKDIKLVTRNTEPVT